MAISDFVQKEVRLAREEGLTTAVKSGATEAVLAALSHLNGSFRRPIWEADWDVCLVLDACRVDVMAEVAPEYSFLPSSVPSAWSVGSASPEWIGNTFTDDYAHELRRSGYVTANPFTGKQGDELDVLNSDVYPVRSQPLGYLDEVWRDQWAQTDLHGIPPDIVTGRGRYAYDRREELGTDRVVVHYMQPHLPFRSRPEWFSGWGGVSKFGEPNRQSEKDAWLKVRDGELPRKEFWAAYRDNLRWVLGEVRHWLECTDARILVTSDHGNGFGEWGVWSHPPNNPAPVVRRVPWLILDGQGRRGDAPPVVGNPPVTAGTDTAVDEQLAALGYR